jgi:hypothetical protein
MRKIVVILFSLFLLSGCTGKVYTVINPQLPGKNEGTVEVEGVIAYGQINVVEKYYSTILVDQASGNQIGSANSGECTPLEKIKFSIRTDFTNPYLLVYKPGFLETGKYGYNFKDGVLTGVNVESQPFISGSDIVSALPFITPEKSVAFISNGLPLCNSGYKLTGVFEAPEILPYE